MLFSTMISYDLSSADNAKDYGFELNLDEYYRGKENGNDTDGYPVQISPPMWGYAVAIIFTLIWQLFWLLYGWSFLFNPTVPKFIPKATYLLFSIALVLLIVRLYVNANDHVILGLLCQIVLTALLIVALGVAHFMMYYHTHELQIEGLVMDKWLTRILVHNGLALFIAWEVVELMVSINITMQYNSGKALKPDVASSIVLFAYMILVTIWMILETCILDQFMRYTLTIYPVFIWYFATALTEQWGLHRNKQTQNIHWLVAALSYTVIIQVWFFIFRISRHLVYSQFQRNIIKYSRIL